MTTVLNRPSTDKPTDRQQSPSGPAPVTAEKATQQLSEAVWKIYSGASGRREFLQLVLHALGEHFGAPYGVIAIESNTGNQQIPFEPIPEAASALAKRCSGPLLDARYRQLASARLFSEPTSGTTLAVLSCPLSMGGEGVVGATCLVIPCGQKIDAHVHLQTLQTLMSLAGSMAVDVGTKTAKAASAKGADMSSASKVAGYQSLQEFAFAVSNNLKAKLGCESVSFGVVRGSRVKLLCMSGTSHVDPKSLGTQQLEQIMEECLDTGDICCYQNTKGGTEGESSGHLLHRKWHSDSSGAAVASIPLMVDDQCRAVLGLRHMLGQSFTKEQLEKVRELASPLMPGALLLERAERNLREHLWTDTLRWIKEQASQDTWTRRIAIGCLAAALMFTVFGKQTYMLSLPCSIVPAEELQLSAPYEGVIREVFVKAGDQVTEGQVLLRLDTRQLLLERQKAASDLSSAEIDAMQGAAMGDVNRAAMGKARADAARCQLEKLDRSLQAAELKAPGEGTILEADLDRRIGEAVPLGEPLVRFAPANRWKVQLEVPEFATPLLASGQNGTFAAVARPASQLHCELTHVRSAAEVREGKNIFVAEAALRDVPPDWIKSGMEGAARLDVGRHAVWWVWMHRAIDSVQVRMWKM
ncbi:MAG: biotin/lipoyl-binding protein [Pirellulales bacterium]